MENDEDSKKVGKLKIFEYIIWFILLSIVSIAVLGQGIQEHHAIVGIIWFIFLMFLTVVIYFKLGLDTISLFFRKIFFMVAFIILLLASYLINLLLRALGLDLSQWRF